MERAHGGDRRTAGNETRGRRGRKQRWYKLSPNALEMLETLLQWWRAEREAADGPLTPEGLLEGLIALYFEEELMERTDGRWQRAGLPE